MVTASSDRDRSVALQGLLPKEKRARVAEQLLMTALAQEGVSINECVNKDWLAPMLQFLPGLGPRKAQALVKVRSHAQPALRARGRAPAP